MKDGEHPSLCTGAVPRAKVKPQRCDKSVNQISAPRGCLPYKWAVARDKKICLLRRMSSCVRAGAGGSEGGKAVTHSNGLIKKNHWENDGEAGSGGAAGLSKLALPWQGRTPRAEALSGEAAYDVCICGTTRLCFWVCPGRQDTLLCE